MLIPGQADSDNVSAAQQTFTPISLLARTRLPLAYLDTAHDGSRFFSADIQILEAAHECGDDGRVLVAKDEGGARLYAIERVRRRTYALCRLASWLNPGDLRLVVQTIVVDQDAPQRKRQVLPSSRPGQPWWSRAAVEQLVPSRTERLSRSTLPKLQMLPTFTADAKDAPSRLLAAPDPILPSLDVLSTTNSETQQLCDPQASPQDQLQDLAKQYLETLYSSRAPLAYFIKGPLSRTRVAFIGGGEALSQVPHLVTCLRDFILGSSAMDKKYRDGIPDFVKELSVHCPATPEAPLKIQRKKKWKAKRDKAGFFSNEKEYVEKWWHTNDSNVSAAESQESMVKRRCATIRGRETYLQVILALEVLSLEATLATRPDQQPTAVVAESQRVDTQFEDPQATTDGKRSKSKKQQNLAALLDTLVDKLCIWHSLGTSSPAKNKSPGNSAEDTHDSDELADFCRDNILPFYISRIPEHAASVNKKLGGPTAPAPLKHKTSSHRKPGEFAARPHAEQRSRKPLTRVSTDTVRLAQKHVPTLHRSATDTDAIPCIKRETSHEVILSAIASVRPRPPTHQRRADLVRSISISGREVDFSAISQVNETKLRKKATLMERLRKEAKDAIDAIRKPNRQLAIKEHAEETDLSFAKATARSRPAHKPRPNPVSQVEATPARRSTINATPHHGRTWASVPQDGRLSGVSVVPGSSARLRTGPCDVPASTFVVPSTNHRSRHGTSNIEDTPSRGFAKFMPQGLAHLPGTLESPVASRHVAIEQTPSKPVKKFMLSGDVAREPAVARELQSTPMKYASKPLAATSLNRLRPYVHDSNEPETATAPDAMYTALGWDEEYEELA